MFWTHHFAHHETLNRARSWLLHLGVAPDQIKANTEGTPRLTLRIDPAQLDGIQMLIHAVERADPEGWPSFWELASQPHSAPRQDDPAEPAELPHAHPTPVGWHPPDRSSEIPQHHRALHEALDRWAWWQVTAR